MADKRKIQRDAKGQISDASLERDPRFLRRIQAARASVRAGHGTKLDDLNQTARPLHARRLRAPLGDVFSVGC